MRSSSPSAAEEVLEPAKPYVALAEDDPDQRELMADALRERGFEVIEAIDGASLLAILRRATVNLVISDLWMPALTGGDVLLTRRREGDATPFVLITAAPPSVTEYLSSLERVTVLRKPFTDGTLIDTVEHVLATVSTRP